LRDANLEAVGHAQIRESAHTSGQLGVNRS
jgi:hypothetical protein